MNPVNSDNYLALASGLASKLTIVRARYRDGAPPVILGRLENLWDTRHEKFHYAGHPDPGPHGMFRRESLIAHARTGETTRDT